MKLITCTVATLAFVTAAVAANTPEQLKDIQKVADEFLQAAIDNNFDNFKAKVSAARIAEYDKNQINCPLARWWESARKAVDKLHAKWTFDKVRSNMPTKVELDYKKTDDEGEEVVTIYMTKDGEEWKVDAAGGVW